MSPSTRTLSSSSSSSTSTLDTSKSFTTNDTNPSKSANNDDDLNHHLPSLALFPHPALHNPTRFLPQNQAILTTYDDWKIILSNNIASFVLVGGSSGTNGYVRPSSLVGKSVLDYIDVSFRSRLQAMIKKRRQELVHLEDSAGGMVLVCGNVLPIVKEDGTKSAASLWLKEKRNDTGSSVYIWIFEEGLICYVDQGIQELLDYEPESLMGKPIDILIPSLALDNNDNNHHIFDGTTNEPLSTNLYSQQQQSSKCYTIRITSIPMIAGLVTIRQDGIIEGCNDVFVKYMFGYSQEELVTGRKSITDLMPQFPGLLQSLRRDDLLQHGIIINNLICRKLVADLADSSSCKTTTITTGSDTPTFGGKRLTQTPHGQPLPVLIAVHRDGTKFEIQLQLKLVEESDDGICALWITFDRDSTFSRFGHKMDGPALEITQHNGLDEQSSPTSPYTPYSPASVTYNRPRAFSTASVTMPEYSAQTLASCIDDYEILDEIGQGAYGLVKLAVHKQDETRKKVVIKYVIKSRILVDCWTRDRKLGMVPAEIHILHTLRKIPHDNCGDMMDYFEDDDYYYIVMELHGAGMDLFDYIELKDTMHESEIRSIFKQIALAVQHLHIHKIVHRDIKDENVVLDQNGGIRLIDFGSAAYIRPGRRYETFVGTLDYAAPEILRGQTYEGPPQDVWALGILLYTLVYRENPFYDIDEIMARELRVPFIFSDGN
ncbi:kinase-like domain-containing protein [Halteromyces radiatus]|uniref:kinase-like domain-containing protein n=1 Tax=Halteromyces radiatus TaxID=101107 RepID=UPI00221E7D63|nr:kinase-like domain-containing protein [Halteromyces radiatus]KAI8093406.1 kinase-like domain-containing protein [Halteromyces radiatus]